ncbi:PIN domain-containing protein [Georgenia sp. M64]|uniref:PIN domain-containing protein n=1 Tax=Georgenia sp. M64 TaxID=3120520 RepID=UPI0030E1832F
MLAVVLDTNAVYSDPWLASAPGKKLLELAAHGSCVVVYPQVVIDELRRQRREAAEKAHRQAANGVSDMEKAGVEVTQTAAHLKASFEKIDLDLNTAFEAVLQLDNVVTAPVPDVAATEILKRDLARRRPFMEVEVGQKSASVGFRDTLIWETVLAVLEQDANYEKVLLATADKGFLSDDLKSLHEDLIDDLDGRHIDRKRAGSVKNVFNANAEVGEAAARAALVTAATDALYELAGEDISLQLVNSGDYDYPDFVQFEIPDMESASISYIDQTTAFEFAEDRSTRTVTATADALISIEGVVFKGDWLSDEGETMSLLGVLNDHYFEASSDVSVRVVVELDTSGDSPEVLSIVLQPGPASGSR